MTKAEYARTMQTKRLTDAVDALRTSEGWQRWLKTRSTFRGYSFNNTMLIASQRPDATRVAGFRAWNKLNRRVCKGATAIWILAPALSKKKNDDPTDDYGRRLYFRSVKVFDVADTEQIPDLEEIPLAAPSSPVHPEGDEQAYALEVLVGKMAADKGWSVHFDQELPPGVMGCQSEPGGVITIDLAPAPVNTQLRIFIHEATHALGVDYEQWTRPEAEAICDAATFIVCDSIGFDVEASVVPYIAGWADYPAERLTELCEIASSKADEILAYLPTEDADAHTTEPEPA